MQLHDRRWSGSPGKVSFALVLVALLAVSCGRDRDQNAAREDRESAAMGDASPSDASPSDVAVGDTDFAEIRRTAEGSEVSFYMWGGDARINAWIDSYVTESVSELHGIKITRVPQDAAVFVNKLITEKQAGRTTGGIDLVWINGENFRNAKKAGVLFGPFAAKLPNFKYVDPEEVEYDFGFPVEGFEAPYGRAQFVFEHDTDVVPDPPTSYVELKDWVRRNPGRFTYPQPPSFTGSAFVRQVFYAVTGGHEQYMDGFDEELFDRKSTLLWDYLNDIEPYLWQKGRSYPKDKAPLDALFLQGEVRINMSYHQADASGRILTGQYPDTVRTFVMSEGSLYNTHFTAIPFNAPNKPGAMVVADFLMSVDAQYSKNLPENWGDFTVLDLDRLPSSAVDLFRTIDLGAATLPLKQLAEHAVPEIPSAYLEHLESGWETHVLRK